MVDMVASNLKLKQRSRNILRRLSTRCEAMSDSDLDTLLFDCNRSVKLALLVAETGLPVEEAQTRLDQAGGVLVKALGPERGSAQVNGTSTPDREYVLCIDGGGTKCAATIANRTGIVGRGIAGPCKL